MQFGMLGSLSNNKLSNLDYTHLKKEFNMLPIVPDSFKITKIQAKTNE